MLNCLKMTLIGMTLLLAITAIAQVNGSTGGGGPSREDLRAVCEELSSNAESLEKKFVEMNGGKYKSVEDFFYQLKITFGKELSLKVTKINSTNNSCEKKQNPKELEILKEILSIWGIGIGEKKHCLGKFTSRTKHLETLKNLINVCHNPENH